MTATMFSSRLLRRLGRTVLLGGLVLLPLAACGGDDDDDDDISGPLADCLDEIDFDEFFFERGDVEELSLNDSESGTISTSDPELDFGGDEVYYYDIYAFTLDGISDVTITVNPSGDADSDFEIYEVATGDGEYINDGGPGDTESASYTEVPDGCYLLFVSIAEVEGTGSYTVEVSED